MDAAVGDVVAQIFVAAVVVVAACVLWNQINIMDFVVATSAAAAAVEDLYSADSKMLNPQIDYYPRLCWLTKVPAWHAFDHRLLN